MNDVFSFKIALNITRRNDGNITSSDVFKACFADCHFDKSVFSALGGDKLQPEAQRKSIWNASTLTHLDHRTNQCELEVQRNIHLQSIANKLPDAFTDTKRVIKSYIQAVNVHARIDVPAGLTISEIANKSNARQKRGRPISARDKFPQKRKIQGKEANAPSVGGTLEEYKLSNTSNPNEAKPAEQDSARMNLPIFSHKYESLEEMSPEKLSPEEEQVLENNEISIHYINTGEILDINRIIVDNVFHLKLLSTLLEVMVKTLP